MPLESEYSDDADTSKAELENILPVVKQVFHEWNLQISEPKITKFVDIRMAGKDELRDDGTPFRESEEWCSSIS